MSAPLDPDLLDALGRLHVPLVHFPIALLPMAAAAELVRAARRRPERSPTGFACLSAGALAAALAAGTGWLHADVDPPAASLAQELLLHRWFGVGAGVLALAAWVAALVRARLHLPLLLASAALALAGGHLGGSLVFGPGWLVDPWRRVLEGGPPAAAPEAGAEVASPGASSSAPGTAGPVPEPSRAIEPPPLEPAAPAVDFVRDVEPLLAARCYSCHGPKRQRGGLRLDQLAPHLAQEPELRVVQPGDPDGSELLRRVMLPADDEDAMPASGDPLAPDQVDLLRRWIRAGALLE